MGLPDVSINILNGQLGRTESTADGVSGLILTGVAVPTVPDPEDPELPPITKGVAVGVGTPIFSVDDARYLGLNEAYDVTNSTHAFRHIVDFYEKAGDGAELWIMLVPATASMEDICNKLHANKYASTLLEAANGTIRLLGVTRDPGVVPTHTIGLDPDVTAAAEKAQILAESFTDVQAPVRVLIEGRDFKGVPSDIHEFNKDSDNRVAVIGLGMEALSPTAALGMVLGMAAGLPVQRKISRVKNGDLGLTEAFLSNGVSVANTSVADITTLHDRGLIVPRTFNGINGFFLSGDHTATTTSDDFSSLARGRVIDKALTIAYQVLVQEIDDDLVLAEGGQLPPVVIQSYKSNVDNALNAQMVSVGEASSAELIIDPNQAILASDQVTASISIVPTGYASNIVVDLKFDNPTI